MAKPSFEQTMTGIVGGCLLAAFLVVAGALVWNVNKPPVLGDVAPSVAPQLLCFQPSSDPVAAAGSPSAASGGRSAEPSPEPFPCAADELAYAPQYRASYDPTARLTGLLAIVTPLVTSIVAFYFGQKAGANEGRARTAEANQALSDAQDQVRQAPSLGTVDKDGLVRALEEKKITR